MTMHAMVAHNRCIRCEHEWHDRPGAWGKYQECPNCGGHYWHWLNRPPGRMEVKS